MCGRRKEGTAGKEKEGTKEVEEVRDGEPGIWNLNFYSDWLFHTFLCFNECKWSPFNQEQNERKKGRESRHLRREDWKKKRQRDGWKEWWRERMREDEKPTGGNRRDRGRESRPRDIRDGEEIEGDEERRRAGQRDRKR